MWIPLTSIVILLNLPITQNKYRFQKFSKSLHCWNYPLDSSLVKPNCFLFSIIWSSTTLQYKWRTFELQSVIPILMLIFKVALFVVLPHKRIRSRKDRHSAYHSSINSKPHAMAPGGPRVVNNCEECLRSRSLNMKVLRNKDDTMDEDVNLNSIVDVYASKFYPNKISDYSFHHSHFIFVSSKFIWEEFMVGCMLREKSICCR